MSNPVYWHPLLYRASIRLLYRHHYNERCQPVADEIEAGDSVVDLCSGDCALYFGWLQQKNVQYTAVDVLPHFVKWMKRNSIDAVQMDLMESEIPSADVIMMLGSLYQFIPEQNALLEKMMNAASKKVIVTEPVQNWAQSRNVLKRFMANVLTTVGQKKHEKRFNQQSFDETMQKFGFQDIQTIAGGRERMAVLRK